MSKETGNNEFNWAIAVHGLMLFLGAAIAAPTIIPEIQTIYFVSQIEPCLSVEPDLFQTLCAVRDYAEFAIKYDRWHEPIAGLMALLMAGVGARGIWVEGHRSVNKGDN